MSTRQFTLAVTLRAVNHLTGPLRAAVRGIGDVDRAASRMENLQKLSKTLKGVGESMQKVGAVTLGAGVGGAVATGLTDVPRMALEASRNLRGMAITAELTPPQLARARREMLGFTTLTNQELPNLIAGMDTMVAATGDFANSLATVPTLGKVATTYRAEMTDLAATAIALKDNLGIVPEQMARTFDVLATGAKEGRFELRDMAREFGTIAPLVKGLNTQAFNRDGIQAAASMAAALRVSFMGAGSAPDAARNFTNFLTKLTAPETVRNFAKHYGISWEKEWKQIAATSEDPIRDAIARIQQLTKGDAFRAGELFGDQQVGNFLRIAMQQLPEYERVRREALKAQGVVDADFRQMMQEPLEQARLLRINLAALAIPALDQPIAKLNRALVRINQNPVLQKGLFGAILGTMALGALMIVVGTAVKAFGPLLVGMGRLWQGAALVRAGFLGAAPAGGVFARSLTRIGAEAGRLPGRLGGVSTALRAGLARAGYAAWWQIALLRRGLTQLPARGFVGTLRAIAMGFRALTLTMLANPLGIAIAALVVGAVLVYKYWAPIRAFFVGFWKGLRSAMAPLTPLFRQVGAALGTAFAPLLRWIRPVVDWVKRLLTPVENVGTAAESLGVRWGTMVGKILSLIIGLPTRMFTAGINIVTSLGDGIRSAAGTLKKEVASIAQMVRDFWPFSPAKAGPLRDIHRIQLVETIAEGIRPGPMVAAMRTATAATLAAASLAGSPSPAFGFVDSSPLAGAAIGGAPAGPSLPPIEINLTVQVDGNGPRVREQARAGAEAAGPVLRREIEKVLRDYGITPSRTAFRRGG